MVAYLWRLTVVTLIICAAGLAPPAPAFACTQPPGGLPYYSVADRVKAAPIVLEGVVIATQGPYYPDYPEAANVQVVQYLKGNGPPVIIISGFGPSSVCLSSVGLGQHLIFYVRGDENGYYAFYLSQFDAVALADSQTIAEAAASSGQQPIFISPAGPLLTQIAIEQRFGPAYTPGATATATLTPTHTLAPTATPTATITPFAFPATPGPGPFIPTPTPSSSPPANTLLSVEAMAVIGLCGVVMLVFGLALGVAVGITYKQRD